MHILVPAITRGTLARTHELKMSAIIWHGSISGALLVFPNKGLSVRGRSPGSFLEQRLEIEPVIWRAVELFIYSVTVDATVC